MLSIVIPTLNEENHLPLLLESIKEQGFGDKEIIIADAGSKDKTVAIAMDYGCKVVPGGLPAKGRNEGAKAASGDILFFLDADTELPEDFFKNALDEFHARKLDIAAFYLFFKDKERVPFFLDKIYNKMIVMLEQVTPFSVIGVFVTKEMFEKLHGYDESIKISEDSDFGKRAVKMDAKFGVIKSTHIFISDRRFVKDGWFTTIAKYFLSHMQTAFIGPVKSDIFKYKFDHYDKEKE